MMTGRVRSSADDRADLVIGKLAEPYPTPTVRRTEGSR
jgi:hypothetical protein